MADDRFNRLRKLERLLENLDFYHSPWDDTLLIDKDLAIEIIKLIHPGQNPEDQILYLEEEEDQEEG